MRSITRAAALVVGLSLAAAACGGEEAAQRNRPDETGTSHDGWGDDVDWSDSGSHGGDSGGSGEMSASAEDSSGDPVASTTAPGSPSSEPAPGTALSAGSVDDNEAWEDYLLYREGALAFGLVAEDIPVGGRQIVTVRGGDGSPVLGALVVVTDGAGQEVARVRTHADGRALFFADVASDPQSQSPSGLTAAVTRGDASTTVELSADSRSHDITLDGAPAPGGAVPLDVLLLLDTTGSMDDEIEQLKANMISVAEQIDDLPGEVDVRFAMTVYRDAGDAFVTRTFDFTDDVRYFTDGLREVVAAGGGDYPEALDEGLHEALTLPSWRGDDAVKMVFLVADAPPHLDPLHSDGDAGPSYALDLLAANEAGIKVFPLASSGSDPQAEFVFRQLAQVTMARFSFLTYGADGASPGDTTPMEVDEYAVLSLDELVVKMVTDELAALG